MGLADYLGWNWKSAGGVPIVCVPGCSVQPDSFTEVLLYLLNMAVGRAPIPLDDARRPDASAASRLIKRAMEEHSLP